MKFVASGISATRFVINELVIVHRVLVGPKGEKLTEMNHRELVRLLALKQAVAE